MTARTLRLGGPRPWVRDPIGVLRLTFPAGDVGGLSRHPGIITGVCVQCMGAAMVAATGATGLRAWLATRTWTWLTAARLRRATVALIALGVVGASVRL